MLQTRFSSTKTPETHLKSCTAERKGSKGITANMVKMSSSSIKTTPTTHVDSQGWNIENATNVARVEKKVSFTKTAETHSNGSNEKQETQNGYVVSLVEANNFSMTTPTTDSNGSNERNQAQNASIVDPVNSTNPSIKTAKTYSNGSVDVQEGQNATSVISAKGKIIFMETAKTHSNGNNEKQEMQNAQRCFSSKTAKTRSGSIEVHGVPNASRAAMTERPFSAMHSALLKGHERRIKLLLKSGSNPNLRDKVRRTPLILLTFYSNEKKALSLARLIMRSGGKIELTDSNGMNALHHACQKNRLELVAFFLEYRMDYEVFAVDKSGMTCLHYAAVSGNESLSTKLASIAKGYGLDINIWDRSFGGVHNRATDRHVKSSVLTSMEKKASENDFTSRQNSLIFQSDSEKQRITRKQDCSLRRSLIIPGDTVSELLVAQANSPAERAPSSAKNSSINDMKSISLPTTSASSERRNTCNNNRTARNPIEQANQYADAEIRQFPRPTKGRNSKELLTDIYHIYEAVNSGAFREGATPPVVKTLNESIPPSLLT